MLAERYKKIIMQRISDEHILADIDKIMDIYVYGTVCLKKLSELNRTDFIGDITLIMDKWNGDNFVGNNFPLSYEYDINKEQNFTEAYDNGTSIEELKELAEYFGFDVEEEDHRFQAFTTYTFRNGGEVMHKIKHFWEYEDYEKE